MVKTLRLLGKIINDLTSNSEPDRHIQALVGLYFELAEQSPTARKLMTGPAILKWAADGKCANCPSG